MLAHGPHYVWSNGNNQRVERVDSTGTTRYVYDGSTVVAETDGTGAIKAYYTPGVGFTTISGGVNQTYYWMQDALGSTTGVQDATQSRVDWMWYQAYGYTYVNRASVGTAYLFGGKHGYYADGDSGMLLLGRRYYLPSFHRFLTQDPSGQKFGDGSRDGQRLVTDLNLYAYAGNNPLLNVDPTGEDWKDAGKWTYRHVLTPVGHLLGHIWTSPNTALGLVGSIGGSYKVDISNETIVVQGGWAASLMQSLAHTPAFTLGDVVLFGSERDQAFIYEHEVQHVWQYRWLGPTFLPCYGIGAIFGAALGDVHDANPFESGADQKAGARHVAQNRYLTPPGRWHHP